MSDLEQIGDSLASKLLDQALKGGTVKSVLFSLALAAVVAVLTAVLVFKLRASAKAAHKLAVDREKKKLVEVEAKTDADRQRVDALTKKIDDRQKKVEKLKEEAKKIQDQLKSLHDKVLPDFE